MTALLAVLLFGCAPPDVRAVAVDRGVRIESPVVARRIDLYDGDRAVATVHPVSSAVFVPEVHATRAQVTLRDGTAHAVTIAPGAAADADQGNRRVTVEGAAFPALADGAPDRSRDPDRLALPTVWWRGRPGSSLYAHRSVTLRGSDDGPADVSIAVSVLRDGAPDSAFALPTGTRDDSRAVVRVPAGATATATFPVFVDRAAVRDGAVTFETVITPLAGGPPVVDRRTVYVSHGGAGADLGLWAALIGAVLGLGLLAAGTRPYLRRARTSDLTTIALFATVQFVWGVGSQLFASAATTVLGPFAPLLTGLVDETVRTALIATLVVLVPRPGTLAASLTVGYLLRLLALGSAMPIDAVWLGDAIIAHEAMLWVTGVTRGKLTGSTSSRALRLACALAPAALFSAATALAVHMAAFRLFYASWYLAMVLLGPSFLYVFVACAVAVPFADGLRRVRA